MALFLFILISSCSSARFVTTQEYEAQKLIDMGDHFYRLKKYEKSINSYMNGVLKFKGYQKNIFILARLIKNYIKLENTLEVDRLKDELIKIPLDSPGEKEAHFYTLGVINLYKNEPIKAEKNFNIAKKYSPDRRNKFFDCLLASGNICN